MDTTRKKKKRTSKKNVDRSTSSHSNKEFGTDQWRNREEWKTATAVMKPDR